MDQYDVSLEEQEVVQEGGRGEPPPEETKLSRLFYLQLYSSVLNAEKAHKRREKDRKRKERRSYKLKSAKRKVKSLSWMDVTNFLARSFSTEGSTRDKDIGDVEDVMVDRRVSVGRGQYGTAAQVGLPQARGHYGHGAEGTPRERGGVYGVPRMTNRNSPEFAGPAAPYPGSGYGGPIYGSSSGGSVIRVQRESGGRQEGGSTSSGSVQGRRKRSGLAQVEEGAAPSLRRGGRWEEEYRDRDRDRAGSRLERGSVVSRQIQVRPGSVQGGQRAQSVGPRVGNTFSRVPDPEARPAQNFSGDETDKDFQFVAGDGGDKTLKYDPKNFSFKLKNRDSVVVEAQETHCSWRQACCNSVYLALATITLVLIITLLSTSPQNYRGHFTTSHLPGGEVSAPKFSLCLPVPFTREKAARAGVSAQLASFLLYSLSPFHPNPDILENKDLLTELTKQYKVLEGRKNPAGLQRLLRSAAPTCSEVIRACQLASRQILRGQDCCSMFFKKFRYQPEGMCIEGTIAARDESTAFPLGPDIQARLTVIINTALVNSLDLDHRVVPWDTVRSRAVLVSVLHQEEAGWSRDPSRDLLLWPGHTATVTARPQVQDNQGANSMVECRRDTFGDQKKVTYTRAGCRNTVMQMIAEKSVNCSLLSLPASPGTDLPFCGPLEGLALMYILREQGDLVHQNPKIRSRFEANLKEKCPMECEKKYWKADVISAEVEEKVANLFGADSKEISIVEFNHNNDKMVRTLQYESGLIVLMNRLGSVAGWLALIIMAVLAARRLCHARKRIQIKRAAKDEMVI